MSRIFFTGIILFVISSVGVCQEVFPNGRFTTENFKVGEEVDYTLSIKYPSELDVVFPDSTYPFTPFEFVQKKYFTTKTAAPYSFDSAVYTLTSFEIDSVQILDLPVFLVTKGDSVAIYPGPDTLVLDHVVTAIPDSIAMIENTRYSNVKLMFNYPYLVVGVTLFVILSIIIFLVFGKTIRRKIVLFRLKRMHERFLNKFIMSIQDLGSANIEKLLFDWKRYMEKLNKIPYTKLTSKEINEVVYDKHLEDSLQSIDRAIYGGLMSADLHSNFDYLRRVSEDSFHNKVEEIKHG